MIIDSLTKDISLPGLKQEITDSDNGPLDIDSSLSKVESILTHLYINHQGKKE